MTRLRGAALFAAWGSWSLKTRYADFPRGLGTDYETYPPIWGRGCQRICSHADFDDCPPLDLLDPRLHAGLVFFAEEDLPHLLPHPLQRLTVQGLFRLQAEDVKAELGPVGRGDLARPQPEDLVFDLLGELAPVQIAEIAAVLGAGIPGVLPCQLREVPPVDDLRAEQVRADAGRLPAGVAVALRDDQDVTGVVGQARVELRSILIDVAADLGIRDRYPQRDLATDDLGDTQRVAQPLLHGFHRETLRPDERLELLGRLGAEALHPLGHFLVQLDVVDDDLVALGLLQLQAAVDHPGQKLTAELFVARRDLLLVLLPEHRDALLQLGERDGVVVDDGDDPVGDRLRRRRDRLGHGLADDGRGQQLGARRDGAAGRYR